MVEALPGTPGEVAEKTGFNVEHVRQVLDDLFYKGVVFPRGDFNQREYYRFARNITQLHDANQASRTTITSRTASYTSCGKTS